ncbi:GNAT family N-acetyltransferase [Microlunatus parietis]|uniref:GNAT superfamily N-acetyltransferase n=1 Tax=Microlunatus parietis TaxID=682979 RepID=A0A7Y9I5W2_9ACTN|nr:GNAT family N-acetyltransferase [Microlunatus parietis]NYE70279.1 GNAT superfamily N-acetyltransferase [Microlunatus parietis]
MDAVALITPPATPGDRLVIRHRLPDGSATDVLGVLVSADPETVVVRTRDDRVVEVRRVAVILAKRVPLISRGPDPLRIPAEDLEQAAVAGWVAHAEPLGDWWLRSGGGFTGRANSCLAVGDPGLPFPEAAQRVIDFAERVGIPPMVQVIADSQQEKGFRELGWTDTYLATDVLVHRLSTLGERPADPRVIIEESLTESWLAAYQEYRPNDADPDLLRALLQGRPPRGLAGIRDGDRLVCVGRGQVSRDWLGISGLWTHPDRRRQGLATAVLIGLVHWAGAKGARNAYLQVAQENSSAHEAYQRLGFRLHHSYRYLRP